MDIEVKKLITKYIDAGANNYQIRKYLNELVTKDQLKENQLPEHR